MASPYCYTPCVPSVSDLIHKLSDLPALIQWAGYIGLFAIIYAETGLLVGVILPGDSLLVSAGFLASQGVLDVWLLGVLVNIAATAGNQTGYFIGKTTGPRIFSRVDARIFKKRHVKRAHDFYERYGPRTVVLARFVPIVRTFAPVIAGVGGMPYTRFAMYDVVGGTAWVWSMLLLGYYLGRLVPGMDRYIDKVILLVIFVSVLPAIIGYMRERRTANGERRTASGKPRD